MQNDDASEENIIEQIVKKSKEKRESKLEDKELKMLLDDLKEVEDKLASLSKALEKVFKNIEKKDREINRLESRLSQKSQDLAIEETNKRIRRRIAKLESILSDYGLIWIGDAAFRENSSNLEIRKIQTGYTPSIEKVKTSAEQLSKNAELRSKKREDVANCAIIDLILYKDGMVSDKGPFRVYDSPSAIQFLRDIEEGYYPTELKEKYPEGVIFKIQDKRTQNFDEDLEETGNGFSGRGQRLGNASSSTGLRAAKSDVIDTASRRKASLRAQEATLEPIGNQATLEPMGNQSKNDEGTAPRTSIEGSLKEKLPEEEKLIHVPSGGSVTRTKRRTSSKPPAFEKRRKSSNKGRNNKQGESYVEDQITSPT